MICEICTRKCTRNARFHTDFGRFSVVFGIVIVYNKRMKPGDKTGLLHCSPVQLRGFRNNDGAKLMDFS